MVSDKDSLSGLCTNTGTVYKLSVEINNTMSAIKLDEETMGRCQFSLSCHCPRQLDVNLLLGLKNRFCKGFFAPVVSEDVVLLVTTTLCTERVFFTVVVFVVVVVVVVVIDVVNVTVLIVVVPEARRVVRP